MSAYHRFVTYLADYLLMALQYMCWILVVATHLCLGLCRERQFESRSVPGSQVTPGTDQNTCMKGTYT